VRDSDITMLELDVTSALCYALFDTYSGTDFLFLFQYRLIVIIAKMQFY